MKYRHLLLVLVVQLALAVGCAHAHAHPDPRAHAHDHIHPHPPKHQPQHEKQNHQPGPTTSEPTTTTTTRPSLPSPSIPPLVALDIFGEHSIRIRIAPPGGHLVDPPIRAILPFAPNITSYDMPDDAITHIHGYSNITLTNGNLRIDVDSNGIITATRISDQTRLLTQQSCIFGTPIIQGGGLLPSSVSGIISFRGTHGEAIYGLGEHHNGQINQMGYQGDTRDSQYYPDSHGGDVMLPYYSSSLGYGFLFNTASHFNVSMSPLSYTWGMHAAANMDFWITTTSTTPPTPATAKQSFIAELLQHYASVVGYASPMPYYVSGFWQCKLRYRSQQEVLSVARGYVDRNLPISLIVVDYFHWTHFGDWSFNQTCWPNVQDMVTELKNLGIELAVSFWPFVTKESSHYEEFMVNHTYVWTDRFSNGTVPLSLEAWEDSTGAYLVDQTEDAVRKAVFQAFWDGYGQYGIRTVWLDASEPERMGYNYGDFSTISHGTDIEQGMSWTRFHAKFMYDGFLSRGYTTSDFFSLSRSTWSGGQSYSNAIWSGDTQSTFEELYTHVRMGQGVALSGQILWTTDIGGFCCADQNDPYFQQLIVRWMQFGAFCPIMRLHGHRLNEPPDNQCGNTGGDNEIWNLAADQVHYDAMVAMMRLREQLRPYIMSINLVASRTGLPMIRPLFLEFPWDPECYNHDGSYMFGDTWLVSPITTYNQLNANIYLPILQDKNQQWVYWFNQEFTYSGGQHVFLQTPINEFPLFYRQNKDVQMKMEEN